MFENLLFFAFAPFTTNLIRPYVSVKKVPIKLVSLKLAECKSIALDENLECFNFFWLIYQKKREAVKPP